MSITIQKSVNALNVRRLVLQLQRCCMSLLIGLRVKSRVAHPCKERCTVQLLFHGRRFLRHHQGRCGVREPVVAILHGVSESLDRVFFTRRPISTIFSKGWDDEHDIPAHSPDIDATSSNRSMNHILLSSVCQSE